MDTIEENSAKKPQPGGARQFPCVSCGGALLFQPGAARLKCPYCGTENDIPLDAGDQEYLKENNFLAALEKLEAEEKDGDKAAPIAEAVRCGACGAATTVSDERSSDRCPYCGSPLSMQNRQSLKLNVQALLPFAVTAEKALSAYREWIFSRWFAPGDFKLRATRSEGMNGIYMPYWTYDSQTLTRYAGQRGDAYYVTEMVSVERNGKRGLEPRQVRKIRWTGVSGTVDLFFDDVLVPASKSLPGHLQNRLEPWGLDNLKPFREEFLAGFVTETYQVGIKEGFTSAQGIMRPKIESAVRRDIGGDEQRITSMDTTHSQVTFKHILLPVWLSAYAYGGQIYRFMINAQTGEAAGDRPWSFWKIAFTVLAGAAALGGLIYCLQ
jgi:LSD1 subclass zinc finger protein